MMGHWYPPIPNLTNILQNDTGGVIEDVKKDRIIDGYGSSDQPLVTLEVSWESEETPSPAPGVDESPFMTSGEIEGTPSRLENEDTPIDIGGSGNGPHFICIYKMGCSITEADLYSCNYKSGRCKFVELKNQKRYQRYFGVKVEKS
ncbi:splicing factor ESS-2 [Tanacetum coccineum]